MRFAYGIVVGAAALLPAGLWAQQKKAQPEIDLALTYSAQYGNRTSNESFWAQGGGAELTATFYHGLGIAANVTGTHAANISSSGVGLTLVTTTFGPTYTWTVSPLQKFTWTMEIRRRIADRHCEWCGQRIS
jgi:hypothetical protein